MTNWTTLLRVWIFILALGTVPKFPGWRSHQTLDMHPSNPSIGSKGIETTPKQFRQISSKQPNQNTIWLFNIAMENGPFIDGVPTFTYYKLWFSMAMLNNQMVVCQCFPILSGWWLTYPSEKYEFVKWEGWHPIYEMEHKIDVWNHQPVIPLLIPLLFLLLTIINHH